MSSGELQMILNINSIQYHLQNLQSIHDDTKESFDSNPRVKYKYINIILDEIELYYHPEMQRQMVQNIRRSIERIKSKEDLGISSINICFLTHSSFILSDIPSNNILKLSLGNGLKSSVNSQENQTFGANIHDLLANEFFMENGFMGEFAKEKIKDIIKYLTFDPNKSESESNIKPKVNWTNVSSKEFISIIGEPVLRMKLAEMYDEKFKVDFEVELLQKRINEIKDSKTES